MSENKKINVNKLNTRITKIISSNEALKEVTPIEWKKCIVSGDKKAVINNIEKDCDGKCVRLEILY